MAVPSSSSHVVAEVTDVSEISAPSADIGRISTADVIKRIKMVFGALNKGILSRAVRLKVSVKQVYIRAQGLSKGKEFMVYSLQFTVTGTKSHGSSISGKNFEYIPPVNEFSWD